MFRRLREWVWGYALEEVREMPKLYIMPSQRPEEYPNGGDERCWMERIAASLGSALAALGVECVQGQEMGAPPEDCGLALFLYSHAAPEVVEAKIKGAEVYYYAYSPASKRAAEIFTIGIKAAYPQPELVESVPTAAREELSCAKTPTLLLKLGYHDNPQDEAWLVNSGEEIAQALARAAADFLGVDQLGA